MTKTLKLFLLIIFILGIYSCDDEIEKVHNYSRVEKFGTHHLSVFRIPHVCSTSVIESDVDIIQINGSYVGRLHANITPVNDTESEIGLTIPIEASISDGNYVIKVDSIANRYIAQIESQLIVIKEINNGVYSEYIGSRITDGSKDNPFMINNNDKFNKFIFALSKDEYHGAGFYFKQTGSFQWSNDEQNDGEGLASQSFAGNYNGDDFYIGGVVINGKNEAGIFRQLLNGATISNWKIENLSISTGDVLGAIAGYAQGSVKISDISVNGIISGTNNVGGLIGNTANGGSVQINNITMNASVLGSKNIGGAIGNANCCSSICNFKTASGFRVGNGNLSDEIIDENIGGVIGCVGNASFKITNTEVIHTSSIDDNAEIVSGDSSVGGLIGSIFNTSESTCEINNCKVIVPIKANNFCGGFIGYAEIAHNLSIANNQSCIITKQGNYVGGIIGSLKFPDSTNYLLSYSNNNIVATNGSEIQIKGTNFVGGVLGYIYGGTVSFTGENYIMASIEGNDCVGGFVGHAENTTLDIGTPLYGKTGTDITGITINANLEAGGVVGYLKSSTLKGKQSLQPSAGINHFDKSDASVICTITGSKKYIGGAVGSALASTISGISVHATITNDNGTYTGGIVGMFYEGNTVNSCSFSGIIEAGDYTGGIAGEINYLSQITQCINYGAISGGVRTGGICGKINNEDDEPGINECANVGNVTGSHFVAGIVGHISADGGEGHQWTTIARCGNFGSVTASSSDWGCVGGIVGKCDSDKICVNRCANHGTITGNGDFKGIGGIAGSLGKDADGLNELDNVDVCYCANTGKIISDRSDDAHMGGIVGYLEEGDEGDEDTNSVVKLCYNCGEVGPAKDATWGGMIGHCDYYTSLRYCINYGNTYESQGGESMIGTVVTSGIVHDTGLYHLAGTGDDDGRNWSSTSFSENQMSSLSTFKGFSETDWVVAQQLNMQGSGESSKTRVILKDCPFQNIVYK